MTLSTPTPLNLGTALNDGTGDTLRAAGTKINANLAALAADIAAVAAVAGSGGGGGGGSPYQPDGTTIVNTAGTISVPAVAADALPAVTTITDSTPVVVGGGQATAGLLKAYILPTFQTTHELTAGPGLAGADEFDVFSAGANGSVKYSLDQLVTYLAARIGTTSTAVGHRYWRVNISTTTYGGFASIAEIAMATSSGGANVLTGGAASASTVEGSAVPSRALDGNPGTWWTATGPLASPSAWWAYDFGAGNTPKIVELKITPRNDSQDGANCAPHTFTVEWSDDGATWVSKQSYVASWAIGVSQTFAVPA